MAFFNIRVMPKNKHKFKNVLNWCLDSPITKPEVDIEDIRCKGLLIKGWLIFSSEERRRLVILDGKREVTLDQNKPRPDVILRVLSESFENHSQLECGFEKPFVPESSSIKVALKDGVSYIPLVEIFIENSMNVLRGKGNWLFLGNDTNKSVEQFTGKMTIYRNELKNWSLYFRDLQSLSKEADTTICTLIAPSKEMVYEEVYPYKRGKKTPISQLQNIVPEDITFIYPESELRNSHFRTYRLTDTHWTHQGAYQATLLVARKLNPTAAQLEDLFIEDKYNNRSLCGDLGSKLYPPVYAQERQLCSFTYRDFLLFDNKINNFGRLIVIYNPSAYQGKTLLIFGSSSAYSMFNYFCRIYRTIVFAHTAGSIDKNMMEIINPTHLLLQTNSRFIVRAPSASFDFFEEVRKKLLDGEINHRYIYRKKKISLTNDRRLIKTLKLLKGLTDSSIETVKEILKTR